MEKRRLGKTGEKLSVVGFGGIILMNETPKTAKDFVAQAIERGVNYFDVAPSYGDAQQRLGPALEPYRKSVFLACKTLERRRKGALKELRDSLRKLRTDYFDLYQLHAVTTIKEVQEILAPGGALEAFVEARAKGLIRFLGFSAHSEEAALAMMKGFDFDAILFPFNWVCWFKGNFGPKVMRQAVKRGMGILALKALAKRTWRQGERPPGNKCWYKPAESEEEAAYSLRFTLSRPVTAAISPGESRYFWWACDAAEEFTPLTKREEAKLKALSRGLTPIFVAKR